MTLFKEQKSMSYSEFKTIADVRNRFDLQIDESKNLFADIPHLP